MPAMTLAFRPTINVVVGLNGTGKSTLLNGIVAEGYAFNKKQGSKKDIPWTTDIGNRDWKKHFKPTWQVAGKFIKLRYYNSSIHSFQNASAFDYDMPLSMQIGGGRLSSGQRLLNSFATILGKFDELNGALVILDQPETSMDYKMVEKLAELILSLAIRQNAQVILATHHRTLMALADKLIVCEKANAPKWMATADYMAAIEGNRILKNYLFKSEEEQRKYWKENS